MTNDPRRVFVLGVQLVEVAIHGLQQAVGRAVESGQRLMNPVCPGGLVRALAIRTQRIQEGLQEARKGVG